MAEGVGVSDEQLDETGLRAIEGSDHMRMAGQFGHDPDGWFRGTVRELVGEVRGSRAREAELARWEFFPDGSAEEDWTSVQCPDCRSFDARVDGRSLGAVVAEVTAHAATAHGRREADQTDSPTHNQPE